MEYIVLYDGVCNLCNRSVQFILLHDRRGCFRFAAQQSEVGQALLRQHGFSTDQIRTVVLIEGNDMYTRSDAALRIALHLGGWWSLCYWIGRLVPKRLRDAVYQFVATHRYRWFGRSETCLLPRPEWRTRFL